MNRIKKIMIGTAVLPIIMTLGGCGQRVIHNEADEIKLYSWEFEDEQELRAELSFENNNARLTVSNGDESCKISGLCVFGDSGLVIIDNKLKNEYYFDYRLSGKTLTLIKDGKEIALSKVQEQRP